MIVTCKNTGKVYRIYNEKEIIVDTKGFFIYNNGKKIEIKESKEDIKRNKR